jgi:hypothetical protein
VLLTRSPLLHQSKKNLSCFSFDLHVLTTPPAFTLSQDQTLRDRILENRFITFPLFLRQGFFEYCYLNIPWWKRIIVYRIYGMLSTVFLENHSGFASAFHGNDLQNRESGQVLSGIRILTECVTLKEHSRNQFELLSAKNESGFTSHTRHCQLLFSFLLEFCESVFSQPSKQVPYYRHHCR